MIDQELALKMARLLETAVPLFEMAASVDARRDAGKPLRNITNQKFAEASRQAVEQAKAALGNDLY